MTLPEPLPEEPLPLAREWLDAAAATATKNPWALALATAGTDGVSSCRYVLLKAFDQTAGFIVFFTNYRSQKSRELDSNARASAAMYWPDPGRQLRFEGTVLRSPGAESDEYFSSRPRLSQLNAWASTQSAPIPPGGLDAALREIELKFPDGSFFLKAEHPKSPANPMNVCRASWNHCCSVVKQSSGMH